VEWEREALGRELREVDLVINCTSLGMGAGDSSPLPAAILHSGLILYDTIYTASRTQLMLAGDAVGARSANGFSMLLYQGALAFEIWFGRPAPVELMREALKVQARASR
jgi:shikimate dehydrogenase